ncbi:MAG: lysylphosphatidylglycerol synthase transmembrane domain-containing protein [Pseudomonadota bacterium]
MRFHGDLSCELSPVRFPNPFRIQPGAKFTLIQQLKKHTFLVKLTISLTLLVYCSQQLDFASIANITTRPAWLFSALLLIVIGHCVGALRFKLLFDPICRVSISTHTKYYFWAGFFNAALPTSIGGDAMRVFWLRDSQVSLHRATIYVLLERALGVVTLLVIAVFSTFFAEIEDSLRTLMWGVVSLFTGISVGVTLIALGSRRLPLIQQLIESLSTLTANLSGRTMVMIFCLSIAYQTITVVTTIFVAESVNLSLSWGIWFFIAPLIWLLTALPLSVGGLGVREVGLIYFLGVYAQAEEYAMAIGLLTFAVYLLAGLIGGVWYMVDRKKI